MSKIKSMAEQIADHVQQSILDGKILPGERLIENEIANQLAVSRTPTRQAFRILASQDLVEIKSNKWNNKRIISTFEILRNNIHCAQVFICAKQKRVKNSLKSTVR